MPASNDPFTNRLVAFFNGPFCHVEMAFPERYGIEPWEKEMWGSSIYQGDNIFYKSKTYQRDGYYSFAIEVTKSQCIKIKNYCRMQSEKGVKFSKIAMYSAYLPVQLFDIEGSFCSKHVTMALQEGEVQEIMHLNPCIVTPSSLYKTLLLNNAKTPIVQIVPSKMTPVETDNDNNNNNNNNNQINKNMLLCTKMASEMITKLRTNNETQNNNNPCDETIIVKMNSNKNIQNDLSFYFVNSYLMNQTKNKTLDFSFTITKA